MKIVNGPLSDLKAYARKEYFLNHNVPVLVMLISEEEYKKLRDIYDSIAKIIQERGIPKRDLAKEAKVPHYSEEFFPTVACTIALIHKKIQGATPMVTPILKTVFGIPDFGKYTYAIMIREEQLLEWGKKITIQNTAQMTEQNRKLVFFLSLLTHEFLHVVEKEKNIPIHTNNEDIDSEIDQQVLRKIKTFHNVNNLF